MMRSTAALLVLTLLSGCGSGQETAVNGVTAEEAAQLNSATEMLDASADSLVAPENMPLDTESNQGAVENGA